MTDPARRVRRLADCHDIVDLRRLARRRLPAAVFHFADGGAEDEVTLRRNTAAFDDLSLVPRYLVDVGEVDTRTEVLGLTLDGPVILAPTGLSRLFHRRGERAVARAAARAGTLYALSSGASTRLEDVAAASDGPKMFQIYCFRDRGLTGEFIARCKAAGYHALCLTVDVPVAGYRQRDLYTGASVPPRITLGGALDALRRPAWLQGWLAGPPIAVENVVHRIPEGRRSSGSVMRYVAEQFDPTVGWRDAAWMIEQWNGPFVVKGVLSVGDAERAADIGASAVVVSNHGGRQLDGAPASIEQLAPVVDAVGDRLEVWLDSGVRRGSHVVKALAAGARAVMVGRPYLWGLGAGGEAGVDRALHLLREEVARCMALTGCRRVADIDRTLLVGACRGGRLRRAAKALRAV